MSYLVLDFETGIKTKHKRKGNPWYNKLVAAGYKYQDTPDASTVYFSDWNCKNFDERFELELKEDLKGVTRLVGHNVKFDLLYIWKYNSFQEWLLNGGKIYDTQLAEYMLTGQRHKFPALRDIAVNKYSCKSREKYMEQYWNNKKGWVSIDGYLGSKNEVGGKEVIGPIDTKDIPRELVLEDVKWDVLDTERIMKCQLHEAKRIGMYQLILEEMEGLLATTEMEYNGIFINQEIKNRNQIQLKQEIKEIDKEIYEIANRYWK